MRTVICGFVLAASVLHAHNAFAQQTTCAASDVECSAGRAIYRAVEGEHGSDGILAYTVGTLCRRPDLVQKGQAAYTASLRDVVDKARANLQHDVPSSTDFAPYSATLDSSVRLSRSSEAAGVMIGLKSVFAMYPNSEAEYCSRMVASLLAAGG